MGDSHNHRQMATDFASDRLQWETIKERVIRSGTVEKLVVSCKSSKFLAF